MVARVAVSTRSEKSGSQGRRRGGTRAGGVVVGQGGATSAADVGGPSAGRPEGREQVVATHPGVVVDQAGLTAGLALGGDEVVGADQQPASGFTSPTPPG